MHLIKKNLSKQAFHSPRFSQKISHILGFDRVLIHKDEIKDVLEFFKLIKVSIETVDLLNYPNYMKSLFKKGINPFYYKIVIIKKFRYIPLSKVDGWLKRSEKFEKRIEVLKDEI